eukprot:gene3807-2693_t
MAPKNKRGKGKTMKITEFVDDYIADDVYDFVDDSWMTEEQAKEAKLKEKLGERFSRVANNALNEKDSFRTTDEKPADSIDALIEQLEPPFVAHFGNLRNGLTEEQFLNIFNKEVVKTHRMVKQDGKTFAFVEFTNRNALAVALVMDKTVQNGRQMYVNLANKKQIDRLLGNDMEASAGSLGSPNQRGGFGSLSRDNFGSTNNLNSSMTSPLSRDMFGANSTTGKEVELTRDILGAAVTGDSPDSPASPLSFDNWRSADDAAEPGEEDVSRPAPPPKRDNWRGGNADTASPVKSMDNWRSEKVAPKEGSNDRETSKKELGGSWRAVGSPKEASAEGKGGWRKEGSPTGGEAKGRGSRGGNNNNSSSTSNPGMKRNDSSADDRWGSLRAINIFIYGFCLLEKRFHETSERSAYTIYTHSFGRKKQKEEQKKNSDAVSADNLGRPFQLLKVERCRQKRRELNPFSLFLALSELIQSRMPLRGMPLFPQTYIYIYIRAVVVMCCCCYTALKGRRVIVVSGKGVNSSKN